MRLIFIFMTFLCFRFEKKRWFGNYLAGYSIFFSKSFTHALRLIQLEAFGASEDFISCCVGQPL